MQMRATARLATLLLVLPIVACSPEAAPFEPDDSLAFAASAPGGEFDQMTAGYLFSCATNRRGDPFCWGNDISGELGDGVSVPPRKTTPVAVLGGLRFRAISSGGEPSNINDPLAVLIGGHTCGIDRMGSAHCWGYGADGQLGTGGTADQHAPVAIAPGTSWLGISAGGFYTCGIDSSNAARCWGRNDFGQLGDGTNTNRLTPVAVAGGLSFASVSAGSFHACGVTTTGQAWCWGGGGNGQLGNGANLDSNVPVPVAGGLTFQSIASAQLHTCGLTTGGQAYCWGYGLNGNLGDGTTNNPAQNTPVAVLGGLTFDQIVSGFGHTCARTTGGLAYCWGLGLNGERGDGTNVQAQATPVATSGGIVFRKLTAGGFHTCASTNSGPAYCWGEGSNGAIGNGGTASVNVPTAVIYP